MFEGMNEKQAREYILSAVGEYCDTYHNVQKPFSEGQRINYAARVYDRDEMINLSDSALKFWLTSGEYTDGFEKSFCGLFGVKHCAFVNSGSSANLLAFAALTSIPSLQK